MHMRSVGVLAAISLLWVGCADQTADVKEPSSNTEYCDLLRPHETSSDEPAPSADDDLLDVYREVAAAGPPDLADD